MKISRIRSRLYRTARLLGDVDAVRKGRVGDRIARRTLGRMMGRLMPRILR